MARVSKTARQQMRALAEQQYQQSESALAFSRKRFKRLDEIIDRVYEREDLVNFYSDRRIWKIYECLNTQKIKEGERSELRDLFKKIMNKSALMSSEHTIHAVFRMFTYRQYWKQALNDWQPKTKRAQSQVNELATFLFCKYKIPDFMFKALEETGTNQELIWFVQLGAGASPINLSNMSIPFTRKMGHYFTSASNRFSIQEALRWGQVKGLGGNEQLAERVAYSWLGYKNFDDELFWEDFIRMLVREEMFNLDKLTELIDYIREQRREHVNYSLKGRTLNSISRQSDEWHQRFSGKAGNLIWKSCGITGFIIQKEEERIVLEELTEEKLLIEEGKIMKHCVASYAMYCSRGRIAIFSMRQYFGEQRLETLATLEVHIGLRKIVQAKAKMNKPVSAEVKKYMMEWAEKQKLMVNAYL